jgi:MOSC domain-containing protein YiiM
MNTFRGKLLHIHRAAGASQDMEELTETPLVAGVGLPGDRYATRTGTYSERHHLDRQVTLIEWETLEALRRDHQVDLLPGEHRRNLTVVGVPLNHLVGVYFNVGEAVLYGGRLNVPCQYLQNHTGKRVFRPLIHRSGLNARVIVEGIVRPGDAVTPVDRYRLDPELVRANELHPTEAAPEVF